MERRGRLSISVSETVIEEIERRRGIIKRSNYVEDLLRTMLGLPSIVEERERLAEQRLHRLQMRGSASTPIEDNEREKSSGGRRRGGK